MARRSKDWPALVNVRMIPEAGRRLTKDEAVAAFQRATETGTAPKGWRVEYIEWKNPARRGSSWKRAGSEEFGGPMQKLLRTFSQSKLHDSLHIAEVAEGKGPKRTEKQQRQAEAKVKGLRAELGKHGAARAEANRALARVKLPETRAKWRSKAEKARKAWDKTETRIERILVPRARREYEFALRYGRSRGRR